MVPVIVNWAEFMMDLYIHIDDGVASVVGGVGGQILIS